MISQKVLLTVFTRTYYRLASSSIRSILLSYCTHRLSKALQISGIVFGGIRVQMRCSREHVTQSSHKPPIEFHKSPIESKEYFKKTCTYRIGTKENYCTFNNTNHIIEAIDR